MKTTWNNGTGSRDCRAVCVLVPLDGSIHAFSGASIPDVCHAAEVAYEKRGKWSNSTYEITYADTTRLVQWREDWDTGHAFPQSSWENGFFWLATQASALRMEAFEAYIRGNLPRTAARWDAAREAEKEFGFAATPAQMETIRLAQEQVAKEKAEHEAKEAERMAASPFASLLGLKGAAR